MRKRFVLSLTAVGALLSLGLYGCSSSTTPSTPPSYTTTVLVASMSGMGSANVDSNLKNPMGLAIGSGSVLTVADNGSGKITFYDSLGVSHVGAKTAQTLNGGMQRPTAVSYNTVSSAFAIPGVGSSLLVTATQNGTIAALGLLGDSISTVASTRTATSVFTGMVLGANGSTPMLYAANFLSGTLDLYNATFGFTGGFTDPSIAAGYAPYNVAMIDNNNQLYVSFAKGSSGQVQTGAGLGQIDLFNMQGQYVKTLATGGTLNAPWGMAIAPSNFGSYSGKLLVANHGDGTINVYNTDGAYQGQLSDASGKPIVIDGVWALVTSNNTLYYTAGPASGTMGVVGKISLK